MVCVTMLASATQNPSSFCHNKEEMLASATILKYRLWDRCLYAGGHEIDQTPDLPPYKDEEHMKLELGGHILTSVGWVMEK